MKQLLDQEQAREGRSRLGGNPNALPAGRYDGSTCERVAALTENLLHQSDTLCHWHVGQPDQANVGYAVQEDELAEIHIDGHYHSPFRSGDLKECSITRIPTEFIGKEYVVALVDQPVGKASTGTGVYKESHPPATDTAARESPATTACA